MPQNEMMLNALKGKAVKKSQPKAQDKKASPATSQAAKKPPPVTVSNPTENGLLEGISSLHSWIKSQTMIKPVGREKDPNSGVVRTNYNNDEEYEDDEVIIRLTTVDPQARLEERVEFSHTSGSFVKSRIGEKMICHLDITSIALHKDSEEAKQQIQREEGVYDDGSEESKMRRASMKVINKNKVVNVLKGPKIDLNDDDSEDEDDDSSEEEDRSKSKSKPAQSSKGPAKPNKNRRKSSAGSVGSVISDEEEEAVKEKGSHQNQFSFVERATQTMNLAVKNDEMQTEPPPRYKYADTVNQSVIYDAYVKYEEMKEAQDADDAKAGPGKQVKETNAAIKRLLAEKTVDKNAEVNKKLLKGARTLERMVNQNTYHDIAQDFKFYEDPSDEYRENSQGTLLPLWTFTFDKAKKLEVTGLCWTPSYTDLFIASFGSYDFYSPESAKKGWVGVFSLKNPAYPEYVCKAHCGVMAVDVHPKHPHMLAVALSDGNIAIYNLQKVNEKPAYISTARNGKHQDIAWQVKWANDNLDGYLNLYSIAGDGRVTNWTIVKTALWYTDTLSITFSQILQNLSKEDTKDNLKDGGRCVAFNPKDETMFLVGTDEGLVYKCTTEYSSRFLQTYHAHNSPVYNICWNTYVTSVFLTCAAEWMIKIWDHKCPQPLFMLDLNSQVGDVAWAPYSSTVFAAVTVDGKVHVFDLNVDKYHPICSQIIVQRKKARLNHIAFNKHSPIIIVGDSRGCVHCLKLSPNLRKQTREVKAALVDKDEKKALMFEVKKLESILAMVREPDENEEDKEEDAQ